MNHDQIRELLFDYYDNELRGETAAEVKSHIAGCRECASNIRGWASTARLVFDPERPASEVFVRRVMNCVRPQRSAIPWLFPALSTLAFAGFLFVVLGFHREEPQVSVDSLLLCSKTETAPVEWLPSSSDLPKDDQVLDYALGGI